MKFFHNPKRKRKTTTRRAKVKRGKGGRFVASKKRRRTTRRRITAKATRRRRRVTSTRRSPVMAKRRRMSTRRASTTRRRPAARRRSYKRIRTAVYKRNPGVVGILTRGVKDAAVAVAGKTVARFIGQKLPAFVPGQTGQIVNAAISAAAIGLLGSRFLGADMARLMVQGALQAPIETALQPVLSGIGLASYPMRPRLAAYSLPALNGYPTAPTPSLASYPNMSAAY